MAKHKRVRRDWPAVVRAHAASGLTVTAFCREHGISRGLLYRWRRRCQDATVPAAESGFIELRAVERPAPGSGVAMVIDGGWRLELEPDFDAGTLERVLCCVTRSGACSP